MSGTDDKLEAKEPAMAPASDSMDGEKLNPVVWQFALAIGDPASTSL